ncbi:MAG: L-threonine 3-dehydrogenase [Bacteriovoracaceae bacterium]|nr:L-threonine 3-dehydrogenase [Bacteriovoracaceae bacterium]
MKALIKKYDKPGLWLGNADLPKLNIHEVLIKIKKTAICGTDLHIYNWDAWAQKTIKTPLVIGHEFVGEVVDVGSDVKAHKPGELVSGEGHIVCGRCRNCLAGRRHLCQTTYGVGIERAGCFAEYLIIPATNVWPADPKIPTDVTACFDPLGNAAHTALSFDVLGEDVLITGAGPIGMMAVGIVKHAGARHIVITDVNPYRLELAKKMGATRTVDVRSKKLEDVMKQLDMKEGFDVGLEMSGNAQAFNDMISTVCHGAKIAVLGILQPGTVIDWDKIVFNGLTIKGIYGREMFETWYKMTMMVQTGLDITPIITHRFHYEEFEKAFALMNTGNSGKIILNWE